MGPVLIGKVNALEAGDPLVYGEPSAAVVEVADEDDIGLWQVHVVAAALQAVAVDTALVVADAPL